MQTNPEQWADDARYLAKLADWAAGQGFCQIEGLMDPDEWCALKWDALNPDANGTGYGYSADALAAALVASIQAAFAEQNARLVEALEWYGDTFCELGSSHECCGRLSSDECSGCQALTTLAALKDRTHG